MKERIQHKVMYIEKKPIQRTLTFENQEEYAKFFNPYCSEIIDYCWKNNVSYKDYWKYERVLLNKDGTMRKPINPNTWLHSKETQEKQRIGWEKYLERKKIANEKRRKTKEINDLKTKIFEAEQEINMIENKITDMQFRLAELEGGGEDEK